MGSAPKAPDPYKQQQQQRAENMWTSQYNTIGSNANQYTPYGSVTSSPGSKIPIYDAQGNISGYGTQWNQTTSLSPQEQAIFDQEEKTKLGMGTLANTELGNAQSTLSQPFNTAGLPDWQTYGAGPNLRNDQAPTDRAAIEDAMMKSYQRGVAPQQAAQDAQMAARGQAPGGQMDYNTQTQRADALAEQTRQAYLASGQESRQAQTAYNQVAQAGWQNENLRADQQNQLRQSEFGERQQTRDQIVNEIAALTGGGQATVPQGQGFQGSQVNPFDVAGAQNQAYQTASQNYQNKLTGLFGIAGGLTKMINPFQMYGAGSGMMG
jgi:hypothetical protein